jgi:hypothetical protein
MTDTAAPIGDDEYVTSKQVRKRYGNRSESWLNRNIQGKKIPEPDLRIGPNRYWRMRTLLDFERA